MSLSKIGTIKNVPVPSLLSVVKDQDWSQQNSGFFSGLSKWQFMVIFGVPAVLLSLGAGYWLWRSRTAVKKVSQTVMDTSSETSNKNNAEVTKPKTLLFLQIKEKGNDAFRKENYAEALELYTKAIKEAPAGKADDLATLFQNRAAVFEKLGDHPQVVMECTEALKHNAKYVKALARRARAYKLTGFLDEALEDITAACILENFATASSIQVADEILKLLGANEADRIMSSKKPTEPSAHSVAAFLRSFHNDPITKIWNQPMSDEETALNLTGYLRAEEDLRRRVYSNIIQLCNEELQNENSLYRTEAFHLRGTFKLLWAHGDDIVPDLHAVADDPKAPNDVKAAALIKLASYYALYDLEGDFNSYFAKADALTPDNVDVYHHRGQVLLTKGEIQSAMEQIEKAAKLAPEFALAIATKWYMTYRSALLQNDGDGVTQAMRNFQKCSKKFPDSPDVFNLYGQLLMENRMFSEADQQFDKVVALDPNNAAVYVHKAMAALSSVNDHEKALSLLREGLAIDDKNEYIWETIGTIELQTGNLERAVAAISSALEYAKSRNEVMMLSSLKKAAEVQCKIKAKLGIEIPNMNNLGGGQPFPF